MSTSAMASAAPSSTPTDTPSDIPDDDTDDVGSFKYFNYFFILLCLVLVAAVLVCLWLNRRKKRKSMEARDNTVNALARDVENLSATPRHRWGYAGWISGLGQLGGAGAPHRTVEGLDERGEAPPPYNPEDKPPSIASLSSLEAEENNHPTGPQHQSAIPLHTLSGRSPPGYDESHESHETSIPLPAAVIMTPPPTGAEVEEEMYRNAAARIRPTLWTRAHDRSASTRRIIHNTGSTT